MTDPAAPTTHPRPAPTAPTASGIAKGTATPIGVDRDRLRETIAEVQVPPLLAALACATGDSSLLRAPWRPDQDRLLEPDTGIAPDDLAAAREAVLDAVCRFADLDQPPGRPVGHPYAEPTPQLVEAVLSYLVGPSAVASSLPLLQDELNVTGQDPRAPAWRASDIAPDRPLRVVVIGAGMSGLVAAHRLLQAGIDTVVMEKNPDVGGTWFENTYPGCRVDVPNHLYSYSFAQRDDWPQHFSDQSVLLEYFRRVADTFGVKDHVELGTEVTSVELDEDRHQWVVSTRGCDGTVRRTEADAVISAVGQLNQPHVPAIAGAERFTGPSFHSARWDHGVDLAGKRVAVIGTGASAVQFVPAIAGTTAELTVFQRTPNWLAPTPEYRRAVPDALTWLFRTVPTAAQWYRFWLFWRNTEGLLAAATVDPAWTAGEQSVSALNDLVRQALTGYLASEFAGAPELLPHVVPTYPPVAKRVIRDDGAWARALTAANVHLVTTPIDQITAEGVRDADGVDHPADVIIYGTGFRASEFLSSLRVVGRGGQELHERWDGDARAYLGITVPGFPNLFCLYGPNTNIVINGSIIFFSECQVDYVLQCLRLLLDSGVRTMDCRQEVHDRYNARIDAANATMAWGASRVSSWYKNARGRVSQNWPGSLVDYWHETRTVRMEDYDLT